MERYARRLVRRARTRTRSTVVVAVVVVVGLSMTAAAATNYLFPLQSGDTIAIGCNDSYLQMERLSPTISKLTCTTSTTTSTTTPPAAACNNGQAAPAAVPEGRRVLVREPHLVRRRWRRASDRCRTCTRSPQSCSYFSSWTETNTSQNSLTQYGGQVTGAFQSGLVNDCSPSATCSTTANNIFRQARAAGKTAINYVEGATTGLLGERQRGQAHPDPLHVGGGRPDASAARRPDPFSEFNPNSLPNFAFITPTLCNDGHDCSNSTVDNWARTNVQPVLDSAAYKAGQVAVFIWYDEDSPVPNMQITPTARPGPFATGGIGYASTLKAWESMLGFPCLANACTAPDLRTVAGI